MFTSKRTMNVPTEKSFKMSVQIVRIVQSSKSWTQRTQWTIKNKHFFMEYEYRIQISVSKAR
jgi:hypothetical protein